MQFYIYENSIRPQIAQKTATQKICGLFCNFLSLFVISAWNCEINKTHFFGPAKEQPSFLGIKIV